METFKIKISPEVLRTDISQMSYSGDNFGYYSGLTKYLSQTTVRNLTYREGGVGTPGGFLFFSEGPEGNLNTFVFWLNQFDTTFIDSETFFLSIGDGQKIVVTRFDGSTYEYTTRGSATDSGLGYLILPVESPNTQPIPSYGNSEVISLDITQTDVSLFTDMSVPILLKQDYEDIGYYSPFDGYISQLFEEVNFTFSATTQFPYRYCIYNTSNYNLNYFQNATYTVDWGDNSLIQEVEVIIPQSFCHTYAVVGSPTTYTITFSGINSVGAYSITKDIQIPYTDIVPTNPFGTVNFISNNGSWVNTPTSQNYINYYDSINTVDGQISSNYVSTPFIVSGFTQSRLSELKVYGPEPYIVGLNRILSDNTEGYVVSITPELTEYIINDQTYIDFANGTTIFVVQSEGFTENTITATTITKFEYLMNVIEQPEIQSNVFIERGKNSGLENFRRIGDVNNTGALQTYGYGFFDVKIYNEV